MTALRKKLGQQPITLENVVLLAPLRVEPNSPCVVHAELRKTVANYQFSITSHDIVYVSGQCRPASSRQPRIKLKEISARCPIERREARNVRQRGHFEFGPRWQSLSRIAFGKDEALATVELPSRFRDEIRDFSLHPALMDVAVGAAMFLIPGYDRPGDLLLPFAYKRLTLYGKLPARFYSHVRTHRDTGSDLIVFDVTLADENGDVLAEIEEFTVKRLRSVADLSQLETASVPWTVPSTDDSAATGIPTKEGLEAFQLHPEKSSRGHGPGLANESLARGADAGRRKRWPIR